MKKYIILFKSTAIFLLGILLFGSLCPRERFSDQPSDEDLLLISPFVNMSDMEPINEAFSVDSNCPWGFEHRGIDFFSTQNLAPFQAVCQGKIKKVLLWKNDGNNNWQVNVELEYNDNFSVTYAFEPMTDNPEHGQNQLHNIMVLIHQQWPDARMCYQ